MRETETPAKPFGSGVPPVTRVPGTAVPDVAARRYPQALQQNMQHNRVIHERSLFLRVAIETVPYVPSDAKVAVEVSARDSSE